MVPTATIVPLLTHFVRWATTQERIVAVALIGSYAREQARPDSDIDLMVITVEPGYYRQAQHWPEELGWEVAQQHDKDYGLVWSRHLLLKDGREIEVCFGSPDWAATGPVDKGTRYVATRGFWILYDPSGLLNRLREAL